MHSFTEPSKSMIDKYKATVPSALIFGQFSQISKKLGKKTDLEAQYVKAGRFHSNLIFQATNVCFLLDVVVGGGGWFIFIGNGNVLFSKPNNSPLYTYTGLSNLSTTTTPPTII